MISTVAAYGAALAWLIGSLLVGLLLTLVIWQRDGGGSQTMIHPLLFTNPVYALGVVLNSPDGAPVSVGTLASLVFLNTDRGAGFGPSIEPWQAAVALQAVAVGLSLAGAVRLLAGRPARPRPLGAPDSPAGGPSQDGGGAGDAPVPAAEAGGP
jgi:hypothetical protein